MLKTNKIKIVVILIVIISFLLSIIFAIFNMNKNTILSGIYINEIDVSEMTKEEAKQVLDELTNNKTNSSIEIYFPNENEEKINIDISSLEVEYDINEAVTQAYNIGRNGNIFKNNFEIVKSLIINNNIDLNFTLNEENLNKTIDSISSNLPDKLVQTSFYIENKNLIITKGKSGNVLKEEDIKEKIYKYLSDLVIKEEYLNAETEYIAPNEINIEEIHEKVYKKPQDAYYEENPFKVFKDVQGIDFDLDKARNLIQKYPQKQEYKIHLKYTDAKIKIEDLDADIFQDILSQYSTKYDSRNENRETNLKLAASKINGTVLSPGEEFSYNTIVGERSIAAGYKEAKIYVSGKIVDGLGGGICQISSTLYNAVIFANMEVIERHNHQFVTSYVEPGRDATVAYGSKDFRFINTRTYPVKINVYVSSGIAKVEIKGIKEKNEYNISFDIKKVSTINYTTKYEYDNTLKEGKEKVKQKGVNGIIVKTYKIIEQNGKTISKKLISQDTYNSINKIIIKGTYKEEKTEDKEDREDKETKVEEIDEVKENEIQEMPE